MTVTGCGRSGEVGTGGSVREAGRAVGDDSVIKLSLYEVVGGSKTADSLLRSPKLKAR